MVENQLNQAGRDLHNIGQIYKRYKRKLFIYRIFLYIFLISSCMTFVAVYYTSVDANIPSTIYLHAGGEDIVELHVPAIGAISQTAGSMQSNIPKQSIHINLNHPVKFRAGKMDSYDMKVRLFGFLPFKQVDIRVIDETELVPVGLPIGLYIKTEGVMVVGVGEIEGEDGKKYSPCKNKLQSGDYIRQINNTEINSKKEVVEAIKQSKGQELEFIVTRKAETVKLFIHPIQNKSGEYKIGIWIRDNTQGVGTMTYLDNKGNFGALGHGINDVDTSLLMELEDGTLYDTQIIGIKKGVEGTPGELTGKIVYSAEHIIGEITENCSMGIFGSCNSKGLAYGTNKPLSIGLKQEIEKGPATILCAFEDGIVESYNVEITKIHINHDNINRGIELKVCDEKLLNKTGGIVQGMSGSPIIQNNKIIGAVTHVFINDPTRGYGIFIENMIERDAIVDW